MSQTITQESIYRVAQSRLPRLQIPPASTYQVAQPQVPNIPAINPLIAAGMSSVQANVELNQRIREEAKVEGDQVFSRLYNRRPPGSPEPPEPPEPSGPSQEEDKKEDNDDERQPLLNDVNRIVERHPPPEGVNPSIYRQFLTDILSRATDVGRYADALQKMLTSGTLIYHLWLESDLKQPLDYTPGSDKEPKKIKPLEERMMDPVPPQCFRHIYKDEKGQLRTMVICKTSGHGHRFYHDT